VGYKVRVLKGLIQDRKFFRRMFLFWRHLFLICSFRFRSFLKLKNFLNIIFYVLNQFISLKYVYSLILIIILYFFILIFNIIFSILLIVFNKYFYKGKKIK